MGSRDSGPGDLTAPSSPPQSLSLLRLEFPHPFAPLANRLSLHKETLASLCLSDVLTAVQKNGEGFFLSHVDKCDLW